MVVVVVVVVVLVVRGVRLGVGGGVVVVVVVVDVDAVVDAAREAVCLVGGDRRAMIIFPGDSAAV